MNDYHDEVIADCEENYLEAFRGFFSRIDQYAAKFHNENSYKLAVALNDIIQHETETLIHQRDLIFTVKNLDRELKKSKQDVLLE